MDSKKILEDGLLEQYLLGDLHPVLRTQVEAALQGDPVLMQRYKVMEADVERMAFEHAVAPPGHIRQSLEAALASPEIKVPLSIAPPTSENFRTSWRVAAALATLFGLGTLWFFLQWQGAQTDLQLLRQQTLDLRQRITTLETDYQETVDTYKSLNDPNTTPLVLKGNAAHTDARAIAYVNHVNKEVLLNPSGLPALDQDHTYQLWADVRGEMISMGTVAAPGDWVRMAYIDQAESLNLTIEPAGGSEHATVANLVSAVLL